jgi:hypothetical protein
MDLLQPQLLIWLLLALAIMLVFLREAKTVAVVADVSTPQLCAEAKTQSKVGVLWQRFCAQQLSRQVSWGLLVAAFSIAMMLERLAVSTALLLGVIFATVFLLKEGQQRWQKVVRHSVVILLSLALSLHLVPGFENWQLLNEVQLSAQSRPFSLYLNLDKPLVLFLLLLLLPDLPGRYRLNFNASIRLLMISLLVVSVILALAVLAGFVALEWKVPHWWWLFAFNNLMFTCVVEEAFFRGYLQRLLSQNVGTVGAMVLVALLFGLAHLGGGWLYALLATGAGLFYGYLYWRSGSLLVAVAGHFMVNIVHLFALTYPALR